ncbi:MAG: LamG domain-containing protein [Thermoleophilia bacterium]
MLIAVIGLLAASSTAGANAAMEATPVNPEPVAAFGFDEVSGVRVLDGSASGLIGSTNATRSPGRYGRGLSFDGRRQAVVVPDAPELDLTDALTLEAWVRPSSPRGWRAAISKEGRASPVYSLVAGDQKGRAVGQSSGGGQVRSSASLSAGRWSHLATTSDGRVMKLYVNGFLVGRAATVPATTSAGPLRIGGSATWGRAFRGRIDEVRVYDRTLDQAEIRRDMKNPVVATTPIKPTQPITPRRRAADPVTPTPPPTTTPPPATPRPPLDGPAFGYVSNSDIVNALDNIERGHGHLARVEFEIGDSPSTLAPFIDAAADRGIEVLLLAGFYGRMPSAAEARNLGQWAATFGPGGSFWADRSDGRLASRYIEFGNESSYTYMGTQDRGREYALRFRDAYDAVQAANPSVRLLAQGEDGGTGSPEWVNAMFDAVPNLASMVGGWTVHPYGPNGKAKVDRMVAQTAARGASSSIPIMITEWGLATDDGRTLSDNYGWNRAMTYAEAAVVADQALAGYVGDPGFGSRLKLFVYYAAHDQRPSGSTNEREHYFGAFRSDGAEKGALTTKLKALADRYAAH